MEEQVVYRGYLIEVTDEQPGLKATIKDNMNDEIGNLRGKHRGRLVTKAKRQVDQTIIEKQKTPDYGTDTAQRVKVRA